MIALEVEARETLFRRVKKWVEKSGATMEVGAPDNRILPLGSPDAPGAKTSIPEFGPVVTARRQFSTNESRLLLEPPNVEFSGPPGPHDQTINRQAPCHRPSSPPATLHPPLRFRALGYGPPLPMAFSNYRIQRSRISGRRSANAYTALGSADCPMVVRLGASIPAWRRPT